MHHIRWFNRSEKIQQKKRSIPNLSVRQELNLSINYMPKEAISSPKFQPEIKPMILSPINMIVAKTPELQSSDSFENLTYVPNYCRKE